MSITRRDFVLGTGSGLVGSAAAWSGAAVPITALASAAPTALAAPVALRFAATGWDGPHPATGAAYGWIVVNQNWRVAWR